MEYHHLLLNDDDDDGGGYTVGNEEMILPKSNVEH